MADPKNVDDSNPSVFEYFPPQGTEKPILMSVPHSGTHFPEEEKSLFRPDVLRHPEDTDWFVDQLYRFAPEMGIGLLVARISRFYVDLNRSPEPKALYRDGRKETHVITDASFSGNPLYRDSNAFGFIDKKKRLDTSYWPYYRQIEYLLQQLKKTWSQVLFFDAHSIKRKIGSWTFPDLILGDRLSTSASPHLSTIALQQLASSTTRIYQVSHNQPFQGGHLTQYFGRPKDGIHALQLEMSQDVYMNEEDTTLNEKKMQAIQPQLKTMLDRLSEALQQMKPGKP
jgi:N-formylglutamate deformylase